MTLKLAVGLIGCFFPYVLAIMAKTLTLDCLWFLATSHNETLNRIYLVFLITSTCQQNTQYTNCSTKNNLTGHLHA